MFASINKAEIAALPIVVPPIAEQRRIVTILDQGLQAIGTAKRNAHACRTRAFALFKGLLDRSIKGTLVAPSAGAEATSKLFEEIQRAREVRLGKAKVARQDQESADSLEAVLFTIPGTWKWCPLSSLTLAIADGVHKTPKYVEHGVPFVTVKNLTVGSGISFDEVNYITREDHLQFLKRTHPEKGDILVTKDGTIGVVRLIESEVEFSIFVSVALIKPAHPELGRFLAYALSAPCVQSQIVPKGAALKHLYLADLRRLAIPLPPLEDQRRIVKTLNEASAATRQLVSIYDRKIVALEKLKASLLTSAVSAAL